MQTISRLSIFCKGRYITPRCERRQVIHKHDLGLELYLYNY